MRSLVSSWTSPDQADLMSDHKADAAAQHISMAAKLPNCFSASNIAAQIQQDLELKS